MREKRELSVPLGFVKGDEGLLSRVCLNLDFTGLLSIVCCDDSGSSLFGDCCCVRTSGYWVPSRLYMQSKASEKATGLATRWDLGDLPGPHLLWPS